MPQVSFIKSGTDKVLSSNAYIIQSITLFNHRSDSLDISPIVTDFSITESIYTYGLTLNINFKDSTNVLERFQVSGHEVIDVVLERQIGEDASSRKKITHRFFLVEFPMYSRMGQFTQVFSAVGVSEHLYLNKFKQISRAYTNVAPEDIITGLLIDDLVYPTGGIKKLNVSVGRLSAVIPFMRPLSIIDMILKKMVSEDGSPFVCFETLQYGITIGSLSFYTSEKTNSVYKKYYQRFTSPNFEPGSAAMLKYEGESILDIASSMKLSKGAVGTQGGYAQTVQTLNLYNKAMVEKTFDYVKDLKKESFMNSFDAFSSKFKIQEHSTQPEKVPLNQLSNASRRYVPLNSGAFSESNVSSLNVDFISTANAFNESLDAIVHNVRLNGDHHLSPGTKIELEFPTVLDPNIKDRNNPNNIDAMQSGKYLITSIIHEFGSRYFCNVQCKRDSLSINLT